jgi:hypothetical protein
VDSVTSAAPVSLYQVDGAQYGVPFDAGMVGILVQRRPVRAGRHHRPARHVGRLLAAGPDPEGRRDHPDRRRRRRQVARPLLVLVPDDARVRLRRDGRDRPDNDFTRDCVVAAGEKVLDLVALEPFQEGFLGAGWDAPDGESGTMASQQCRDGPHGPVGAGRVPHPGRHRRRLGDPVDGRLVPVPGGRRRRGRPDRRVRRCQRVRGRQGRPARGGRLPRVHHQRREPADVGSQQRAPGEPDRERRVTDPNMQAVFAGLNELDVPAAVPRPVLHGRGRRQVNDQTALLFAGATSPADAAAAITAVPAADPRPPERSVGDSPAGSHRAPSDHDMIPAPLTPPRVANRLGRMPWPTVAPVPRCLRCAVRVFLLYPIVQSTRYSLYDWNGLGPLDDFVGLDNFRRRFSDDRFRSTRSATTDPRRALAAGAAAVPRSASRCCSTRSIRGRAVLRTIFFAPYVLSEVVTGVVWRQILRPNGLLDRASMGSGSAAWSQGWLSDPTSCSTRCSSSSRGSTSGST